MSEQKVNSIWVKDAFLGNDWARDVRIEIDNHGDIVNYQADCEANGAIIVQGTLLPGMTNLHSHAHQRAMAGLAEKASGNNQDSFWTWRTTMYYYLERIRPDDLKAIASQLYLEMLQFGYTCVGEFQYLHHDIDGKPYQDRAEMTKQCHQAAVDTGIAFTALPVLYAYGGFGAQIASDGQKRFLNDVEQFAEIVSSLNLEISQSSNSSLGIAPHSLRAVDQQLLEQTFTNCPQAEVIHIHIAEQLKEIEDCLAWCDQRPVEWLLDHFEVNENWCLIHATHMNESETTKLAASGAIAGLCPTTEANLGDGFFNAGQYFSLNGSWGIGSDSHISISPFEELRWLEYGQRLQTNQRNILNTPEQPNTGSHLYQQALAGGAEATARKTGMIKPGYRADFIIIDDEHPRLYGRDQDNLIDSLIFSGNDNPVKDVYVGGVKVIDSGHHIDEEAIRNNFRSTLKHLAG